MKSAHTMYDWFAASVAAEGDRIALEVDHERWTYTELADLAERLAGLLIRHNGSAVPDRVGLLSARNVLTYAGYLAAQRLGATVVPLNPSFPTARNAAIVETAGLDIVLVDRLVGEEAATVPEFSLPVLRLDANELAGLCEGRAPELPDSSAGPRDIAYILFTSGSTGTPKGVRIEHRNVSSYLEHVIPRYGVGPGDRLSQTFDLTFDPSVFDMFTAWGSGATLVVPTRNDVLSPVRFVNRHRITHWNSVPSIISFALGLRSLKPGSMPSLRWSMFCGEPLTLPQAAAWRQAAPNSAVENIYGPTEMTITCTEYRLPERQESWPRPANGTVPIGTVYSSLEHLVVGEGGLPGSDGELCLRGPQRFPGYADPADNAGRFLSFDGERTSTYDGSGPLTDDHWYRTGDRVGYHEGELVHFGRLDQQVKVRGYRVELGEIEAVLRDQHGVTDAVVLAVPDGDGEVELAAAYTGAARDQEELLAALSVLLPTYMMPRTVTAFDALPLNANGKIDRRALGGAFTGSASQQRGAA